MKRMKYPATLRELDIELESLTKSFLDGIRQNAQGLEELSIKFNRLDQSTVQVISQFQQEIEASNATG